jgi:signal transduction histidine kinase/FixJ family two-component response regulator
MTFKLSRVLGVAGHTVSGLTGRSHRNVSLRTRLLLSFVLVTSGLTCATLLVVRRNAHARAQQEIERDARNAIWTFRVVQRQEQTALSRKADLLASLALMRNGDASAIEDASQDPWQSDDCNLFVLADKNAKIVALHLTTQTFPESAAQEMMSRSVRLGETSGWWFGGGNLYQVVIQPFYDGPLRKKNLLGFVAVGHLIDDQSAKDLGRIASSDVTFRYGDEVATSTLPPLKVLELTREIRHRRAITRVILDGETYYENFVDLTPGLRPSANLIVLKSYNEFEAYLKRVNHLLFGLGLAAILAGGTLIFLISDTVTRPLAALVQGVQALERGDFTFPLKAAGDDELSRLIRAFDGMRSTLQRNEAQREQLEGQLRQAQKMEALGRLAGGVAHDFNNLLTVIRGHSELLLDGRKSCEPLYRSSEQILKTADRAASLTRQLLAFSRMQVLQPKVLDINDLVADMGKLLRRIIHEDIEFSLRLGDSLGRVKADPGQLEQVLLNLTVNASDSMPLGGKLTIETQNFVADKLYAGMHPSIEPGQYVLVSVADTGHGMDAATKARIFEPFFTTKEAGKGTGLGLATVYGVVKQSGGFILVESEPGNGSRFELYFPRTEEPVEAGHSEIVSKASAPVGQRKTVLIVEDEREVRELACEFLAAAGYNVLTAEDGLEALETAQRLGGSIQAVLTDVVMPRMRGPELVKRLKILLPRLSFVYMTGYLEPDEGARASLGGAQILRKPFSRDDIVRQVGLALNGRRPVRTRTQMKAVKRSPLIRNASEVHSPTSNTPNLKSAT